MAIHERGRLDYYWKTCPEIILSRFLNGHHFFFQTWRSSSEPALVENSLGRGLPGGAKQTVHTSFSSL